MSPEQIDHIKQLLARDLEIEAMPEILRDRLLEELAGNAVIAIAKLTEAHLDEPARTEYESLSEGTTPEEAQQFLEEHIPYYARLVEEAVREVLLAHRQAVNGSL